jgi:ubiquinone/menaquinone biosynthesis C-methylase UbiE
MRHTVHSCQDLVANNNTPSFWNNKLLSNRSLIVRSSIYLKKNNLVLKHLKYIKGKVLNVGIGYGYIEELIVKHKLELEMCGIDISKFAINNAKKRFLGRFIVSSVRNIPFKKNKFDCVLALDILEHLSKERINQALSEIHRVLKSNGLFIISIPMNESVKDRLENRHVRIYTKKIIESELEKNSFKVIKSYALTAFEKLFAIKSIINHIFEIKKPNLLILVCKKLNTK